MLAHPGVYRLFRRLTGSERLNREFIAQYVRPRPGEVLLDVGCGPADVLACVPESVRYVGLDSSARYLASAAYRFRHRFRSVSFVCEDLGAEWSPSIKDCDLAMAMGVLHHLDDQAVLHLLASIRRVLKPGGRFISYDPCFTEPQHPAARWIHRHDRGKFVRWESEYQRLVEAAFPYYRKTLRTDLCTVPATAIIFACES